MHQLSGDILNIVKLLLCIHANVPQDEADCDDFCAKFLIIENINNLFVLLFRWNGSLFTF